MSYALIDTTDLTALGDAIRAKTSTTATMSVSAMADAVDGISIGGGNSGSSIPEKGIIFEENKNASYIINIKCYGRTDAYYFSTYGAIYFPVGGCCDWQRNYKNWTKMNVNIYDENVNGIPYGFLYNTEDVQSLPELTFTSVSPIKVINNYGLYGCYNVASGTFDANFFADVRYIGDYGCYGMGITNLELSNTIECIGGYAFANSSTLTTITIPVDALQTISNRAFIGCSSLTTVYFTGTKLSNLSINNHTFKSVASITDIYVPWSEGEVAYAPWGATNATIHYDYTPIS